MSLVINTDNVWEVLLADGWHKVEPLDDGDDEQSSFNIDAYEYVEGTGRDRLVVLGGGRCAGVPSTGASWQEKDGVVSIPVTSIIAVKTRKCRGTYEA
jgi:hypothetical protein